MRLAFLVTALLVLGACSNEEGQASAHANEQSLPTQPSPQQLRQESQPKVPPSYPLRFLDQAAKEPARWEARLIERDAHGFCTFWSWRVLVEGSQHPLLVYDSIEKPMREGIEVFAEVRQRGGDWLARALVPMARGIHEEPVDLKLVQVAVFGGGVVDGESNPVINAELRLYQAEGTMAPRFYTHPHLAWTDQAGEFRFSGVEPGYYRLRIVTEGREAVVLQLELKGGDSEAYELKMTTLESTAELPIAVLGTSDQHLPSTLLALRSLDGQGVRRVAHPRFEKDPLAQLMQAGVGYAGLFPLLPEGRYELTVLGLDSNPYEPASSLLEFDTLEDGIRIQAVPSTESHELRFSVSAQGSSEALGDCYLRFSSASWWASKALILHPTEKGAGFSPDMPTPEWMVGHVGYQPAFGVFAPGDAEGGETHEQVELVPGWGCELVFRDGSDRLPRPEFDSWRRTGAVHLASPLEGVLVFADGEQVGRSDATGRLRLKLPSAPVTLRFQHPGWQELPHYLTGFLDAHDTRALETAGSTVVWFDRLE